MSCEEGEVCWGRAPGGSERLVSTASRPESSRDVGPPRFLERPPRPREATRVRDPIRRRDKHGADGAALAATVVAAGVGERPGGARAASGAAVLARGAGARRGRRPGPRRERGAEGRPGGGARGGLGWPGAPSPPGEGGSGSASPPGAQNSEWRFPCFLSSPNNANKAYSLLAGR